MFGESNLRSIKVKVPVKVPLVVTIVCLWELDEVSVTSLINEDSLPVPTKQSYETDVLESEIVSKW